MLVGVAVIVGALVALAGKTPRAKGAQAVRVGYLSGSRLRAVARLSCVAGCVCAPLYIRASGSRPLEDTTSTTEFTPRHRVQAKADGAKAADGCALRLELTTEGEPFKLVALHVHSA